MMMMTIMVMTMIIMITTIGQRITIRKIVVTITITKQMLPITNNNIAKIIVVIIK